MKKVNNAVYLLIVTLLFAGNVSTGMVRPLKANNLASSDFAPRSKAIEQSLPYTTTALNTLFTQEAYFKPSDPKLEGFFGFSVAISGETIVVGAPGTNAAYVFVRQDGNWKLQARLSTLTYNLLAT